MTAVPIEPFDPANPLPTGTLAIDASAGTGKTFALAGLTTRAVVELEAAPGELLVVTFTRAAAAELRDRVRRQLVAAAELFAGDGPPPPEYAWLANLRAADPGGRQRQLGHLERAVTEFDTMTVTTIHGFATQVLGTLGNAAGVDPDAVLVNDDAELVTEVAGDVLAAAAVERADDDGMPGLDDLVRAVRTAASLPGVDLRPAPGRDGDEVATLGTALVRRCLDAMATRRLRRGSMSFGDVLDHLATALSGPSGAEVAAALRSRYRVALIDEFQDTDPVQWQILSTIFGEPGPDHRLVIVGDPKQAIYSFRGADVHTYTSAVADRPGLERRSLATNWRSDGIFLSALDTLFDGSTLGDAAIAYTPVDPADAHRHRRLVRTDGGQVEPLALRLAIGPGLDRNKDGRVSVDGARLAIWSDLATQVIDLLDHGRIPTDAGDRPILPSDIAVLTRRRKDGEAVRSALQSRGVPAVVAKGASVLESEAAEHWRRLLAALARPSEPRRARAFALSVFVGLGADQVAALDDAGLAAVQDRLWSWAETLDHLGVAEWLRQVWVESGVAARVLGHDGGDRLVTDLAHIGELFQAAAVHDRLGPSGLMAVLDTPAAAFDDADADGGPAARRLESDDAAVSIMTVWNAKGLQFPVVCVPTMWSNPSVQRPPVVYQDPDTGRRTYDTVGKDTWADGTTEKQRKDLAKREVLGEDLRLLYVALTRAEHHAIVWWANAQSAGASGLAHLLFARDPDGRLDPAAYGALSVKPPADAQALDTLAPLIARSGGTMSAASHGRHGPSPSWQAPGAGGTGSPLEVARLERNPDRWATRWSFTAMTNRMDEAHLDPSDTSLADRGAADESSPGSVDPTTGEHDVLGAPPPLLPQDGPEPGHADGPLVSPLTKLPAGAEFGTVVHAVLERIDFASPQLEDDLEKAAAAELDWRPVDLTPPGEPGGTAADGRRLLVDGLGAAIATPLGQVAGGIALRDVPLHDRLSELSFEIPLGKPAFRPRVRDIGRLVLDHLAAGDPLAGWAAELADGEVEVELAGHLTGSIDVVLRLPGTEPRFVVVDYKTNRLTRPGAAPGPGAYGREAMAAAMAEHHYPLQALLYLVALHRYLRWRLPGYDPDRHLGGAAYLFVRGMAGPDTPVHDGHPDGVFGWRVPTALVGELSDLLDGHPTTEVVR
ncbi:MAG: UvrD-helicase domain-containing protein [Actinomycetota bacterium]|nr:UvrD-helicase domain-containing protein [Actinomycetota bacterium]